jgi:FdhD protein
MCGKWTLDQLELHCDALPDGPNIDAAVLESLPEKLRTVQPGFGATGGLHAAGLFDVAGELLAAREDVGRHNAVDKVIGALLRRGGPRMGLMAVSSRAGYELVQKCAVGGIPVLLAVGAASTLAIAAAERMNITLIGFARPGRMTVYSSIARVS